MGDKFKYLIQNNTLYGLGDRGQSLETGPRHNLTSLTVSPLTDGRVLSEMVCGTPQSAMHLRELLARMGLDAGDLDPDIFEMLPALIVKQELPQTNDETPKEKPASKERVCKVCLGAKGPIVKKPGRGRPPTMCEVCKAEAAAEDK